MIKLSISNIGWAKENDELMYKTLQELGYDGVEIAPTRIYETNPYDCNDEAKEYAKNLKEEYGLVVPSMQSIWFGKNEKIFGSIEERNELLDYTKKAILFAQSIGCKNLVFGCPRNRVVSKEEDMDIAVSFFKELGDYAYEHDTVLAMEPNPPMYNTNFINKTCEAFELVKKVDSKGLLVNVDLGTVIANDEDIDILNENIELINHIHISEPGLEPIKERELHKRLKDILIDKDYDRFVSIEMKNCLEVDGVVEILKYIKGIYN